MRKVRNGVVSNVLTSVDGVSSQQLDQHDSFGSFNTPISVTGESPADSHFTNEDFSRFNKCSSKTKTTAMAASLFKNVQPIFLSGGMKDWERNNERFPLKCSAIHDAKDSVALPQLTNDIIHSPIHFFKGNSLKASKWGSIHKLKTVKVVCFLFVIRLNLLNFGFYWISLNWLTVNHLFFCYRRIGNGHGDQHCVTVEPTWS